MGPFSDGTYARGIYVRRIRRLKISASAEVPIACHAFTVRLVPAEDITPIAPRRRTSLLSDTTMLPRLIRTQSTLLRRGYATAPPTQNRVRNTLLLQAGVGFTAACGVVVYSNWRDQNGDVCSLLPAPEAVLTSP